MITPLNRIPPTYRLAALVLAWLASLVAVGWWQRHDGAAKVENAWLARAFQQAADAATRIQALQVAARATEQRHSQALAVLSAQYQKELQDAQTRRDRDVAAIRAGTLRLRDPAPHLMSTCGSDPSPTPTAPGGRDGAAGAELSGPAAEFLYRFASEADDLARQLATCQQVIQQDRRN